MKVLIADDHHISRITIDSYVRQMGHTTILAASGSEAIALWEKERPACVLTDWNMPDCTGVDCVKHIRSHQGDSYTYTILVTARDQQEDLVEGFEAGVDDYVTKPVSKRELMLRMKAGERLLELQSKDILVFALASLAEIRDDSTGEHLERIRTYSSMLAEQLARSNAFPDLIDQRFIDAVYDSSPLHDVGKVGIPDSVLLKAGRLTADEFEVMKSHTTIGERTLSNVYKKGHGGMVMKMAVEIAGSHHEKWDGSGYPRGLQGDAIPLSGRIVALADVYDALRSSRVYKEAYSHGKSRAIVLDNRGKHFDPKVVDAFLDIEDQFVQLSVSFSQDKAVAGLEQTRMVD